MDQYVLRSVLRTGTGNNKKLIIVTSNYQHGEISEMVASVNRHGKLLLLNAGICTSLLMHGWEKLPAHSSMFPG